MSGQPATIATSPNSELSAVAQLVGNARDVTLVAHVQPDADALGSALALGLALHRRGATVRVTFGEPEQAPESLRALDVAGLIVPPHEVPAEPELLVALDTANRARLGCLSDRVDTATAVLVVDHHLTNERFGTHHWSMPGLRRPRCWCCGCSMRSGRAWTSRSPAAFTPGWSPTPVAFAELTSGPMRSPPGC